ncbi:hypothetical protein Glove_212g222 [Diversispora epigaea]|uniref:Uncharacterized protein n=1 Tax=Diversispora epigaea TaxID=1348612 RepID=A0A397IL76_9GLOM|nr:hypothetical protein Glove_212g222 [Diversispora epigaea]
MSIASLLKEHSDIKPLVHHDMNSISIEDVGNEPNQPIKMENGLDEEQETDEEFAVRMEQYNLERQRWFKVKEFHYFMGKN